METIELKDLSVSEIMKRWPAAMRLFIDRRLLCVGCPIACFHSIDEACRAHGIATEAFLLALQQIENAQESG